MNCIKCGKDIADEFMFCPFCGKKQAVKSQTQASADWRKAHPDHRKQYCAEWHKAHPDYNKEYYKANKDKLLAKQKAWARDHKATISKYPSVQKRWRDYAESLADYAEAKEQAYQDNLHSETSVFVLTAIDAYEEYKKEET